jgi:hypothetical protein
MLKKCLGVVALVLFLGSFQAKSQTLTFYPNLSWLEVSTSPKKVVWAQLRIQGNSLFTGMNTEIAPHFTVAKNSNNLFYVGPGVQFNVLNYYQGKKILNGYTLNMGTRIYPFKENKRAAVAFELSPYASSAFDIGAWRYLFGLSYSFGKNKE